MSWSRHPVIYEINTWVWLGELNRKYHRLVTLASVPDSDWDDLGSFGFDAVWFMGVWRRSPAGTAIANQNAGLVEDFRRALPDFDPDDNVGSPYCVRDYIVDERLGGRDGLAAARRSLSARGLALVLDFVPNHVAPDHPWVTTHPEYFIRGQSDDARTDPVSFVQVGTEVFARGRDPYFPAWPDVLQLNAFDPGLRKAVISTLSDIAAQCDAVRCDMAMLPMNDVFERTWGPRAGARPPTEYWSDLIASVKHAHPDFVFVAEAYWDLEWPLQQMGFDFCYDKRLYDRLILEHGAADAIHGHLCADTSYQAKLVRFIENHDETRAAAAFSPAKARAAAVTVATIPGASLFHEGQFEGRRVRLPVFLRRRPVEPADAGLQAFYRTLLRETQGLRDGDWQLCDRTGWPDNSSYEHLVAWCWRGAAGRLMVIVNLSDSDAQAMVRLPWDDLMGMTWRMTDLFTAQTYERRGDDMSGAGLYVGLAPWGFHVLTGWQAESA